MKTTGRKRKYGSITAMMKEELRMSPEMGYEKAEKMVKAQFKNSKFDKRHLAWYKSAAKRGALKGVR